MNLVEARAPVVSVTKTTLPPPTPPPPRPRPKPRLQQVKPKLLRIRLRRAGMPPGAKPSETSKPAQGCPFHPGCLDRMGAKSFSLLRPSRPRQVFSSLYLAPPSLILQTLLYPSPGAYYREAPLVSSLFRTFRPSLAPLYADQHAFLPTMTALQPELWQSFRSSLSNDLLLLKPVGLAALPPGSRLLRVGQQSVSKLADLPTLPPDTRRVWLQTSSPHTGACVLSEASQAVLRLWLDLCQSGTAVRSLLRPWNVLLSQCLCDAGGPGWLCSVSLTADSFSFATPSLAKSFGSYSIGFRFPHPRSPTSPPGNFWPSAHWSSFLMPFSVRGTCPSSAFLSAITPLPTLPVGRVYLWLKACATYSAPFFSVNKPAAYRSISTMSPASRMTLPTR